MIHEQSVTIFCITNQIKNTIFKSYQERHDIVFKFTKNSSDITCKKKMIRVYSNLDGNWKTSNLTFLWHD